MGMSMRKAARVCLLIAAFLAIGLDPCLNLPPSGLADSHALILTAGHLGASFAVTKPQRSSLQTNRPMRTYSLYATTTQAHAAPHLARVTTLETGRSIRTLQSGHSDSCSIRAPPQIPSSRS